MTGNEGAETARAALAILAAMYPREHRARVQLRFLATMAEDFRSCGMEAPAWLAEVRREIEEEGGAAA